MTMAHDGMGEHVLMEMPAPPNSIPMLGAKGPHGGITMGGMFSIVKVREKVSADYRDPGWYQAPKDTIAKQANPETMKKDGNYLMKYLLISFVFVLSSCAASSILDNPNARHPANKASGANVKSYRATALGFTSEEFRSKAKVTTGHHHHYHAQPSSRPTSQPSSRPASQPSSRPTSQPSSRPARDTHHDHSHHHGGHNHD